MILAIIVLLLVTTFLLTLPPIQTKLAKYLTDDLKKTHKVDINVERVAITPFLFVKLKNVHIRDHHQDTLIHVNLLRTNVLDFKELIDGRLIFGDLVADGLFLNIKNYKNEEFTNLDIFIDAFDDGKPSSGKFLLKANHLVIRNSRFTIHDFNRVKPKDVDFKNLNGNIENFKIKGPDVTMAINNLSFKDYTGLEVTKLKSNFTYTKKNIILEELDLKTPFSRYEGLVRLDYKREDFKDFNNKVVFSFLAKEAKISSSDIYHFYKDIGKDILYDLKGDFKGTLNDLDAANFTVKDNLNNEIKGNLVFKNMFDRTKDFLMVGQIDHLHTNAKNLEKLLPNVLGNGFLPKEIYRIGTFTYQGDIELTPKFLKTAFQLKTDIGQVIGDLKMQNINEVKKATYLGKIETKAFNLGYLIGEKDLGRVSIKVDVLGKGFNQNTIDAVLKGDIYAIEFKKYNYRNILFDGRFKKPIFKGLVKINDPNLLMDFDGLIDVSKKENLYKFNATVDYANLKVLNFMPRDSIAIFKGKINSDLIGNNLDNIYGNIFMERASFQNNKKVYSFEEFSLSSVFDKDRVRTIDIMSGDLLKGSINGKFSFKEVLPMVENAWGSTYSNFSPNKLKKGQYIQFNFGVFSHLLEIFYPDIELDNKTEVKGKIVADDNVFELDLKTEFINFSDVKLKNIDLKVDNKNPLFNTYIAIDSIIHKSYKLSEFNLINMTSNDTLYMRSEFKGGKKATDIYELNFYHAFDAQKNNIIGLQKSELNINKNIWFINEKSDKKASIIFDNKLENFQFKNIIFSHLDQNIVFNGKTIGNNTKDLRLDVNKVLLEEFLPEMEDLSVKGLVNGHFELKQIAGAYQPKTDFYVNQLVVNNYDIGDLNLKLLGDDNYQIVDLKSYITHKGKRTFNAEGQINYEDKNKTFLVDISTNDFNLGAFNSLAGDVVSNIRGFVSGETRLRGSMNEPKLNGRLFLTQAGLKIPYINVDFDINDNAIVDLTENQFKISNTKLTDVKYNTNAILSGTINHKNLNNWRFDLSIASDRMLAFDKEDDDETPYYGVAFINGKGAITGPIEKLVIDVNAKSAEGTKIKIPISNTLDVTENSYIYFITPEEKYYLNKKTETKTITGLELNFELDISQNAEFEIILDKASGHAMKGTGSGNIVMEINTLGKFNMYGDYHIWNGTYDYKYRGVINKKFDVQKGGYIVWDGDPLKAKVNAEAKYKTTANPSLLLTNFDANSASRRIPVEVGIVIDGSIDDPKPQFKLEFPNVSSVFKSELDTQLNTQDIKDQQAIYLLASGTFFNPNLGLLNQDILFNNLFEAFSGMVGNVINAGNNVNVTLDYTAGRRADGNIPNTDATVGLRTSFVISDRLSFRGSLGVPVGGFAQNSFLGSGELLYRVSADGALNLRTFYRENDINFIGEGIGFTSGFGLSYQVDFDNLKQLGSKFLSGFKSQKALRREDEINDSYQTPDYIQFNTKKDDKIKTDIDKKDRPSEGD